MLRVLQIDLYLDLLAGQIGRDRRANALGKELIDLRRAAADVGGRVKVLEDLLARHAEHRVACDTVDHIVLETLLLDALAGRHGVLADALMQLLTVAAALYRVHHDVLGSHEGQLVHHVRLDDLGVNDKAGNDVDHDAEDSVDREERFGNRDALVRGVVERALEPLGRGGERRG